MEYMHQPFETIATICTLLHICLHYVKCGGLRGVSQQGIFVLKFYNCLHTPGNDLLLKRLKWHWFIRTKNWLQFSVHFTEEVNKTWLKQFFSDRPIEASHTSSVDVGESTGRERENNIITSPGKWDAREIGAEKIRAAPCSRGSRSLIVFFTTEKEKSTAKG